MTVSLLDEKRKQKGERKALSKKQQKAIVALMSCPSVEEAAAQTGIGSRTLHRWLAQPEFSEAYRKARHRSMSRALGQLQEAVEEAISTLRRVLFDPEALASARVSSARTILDFANKSVEMENFEIRLSKLEELMEQHR